MILVNCSNLRAAGGKAVAINFIHWVEKHSAEKYCFVVPHHPDYIVLKAQSKHRIYILSKFLTNTILGRLIIDNLLFDLIARRIKAKVLFTMGNFAVRCSCSQALLYMWPYPNYIDFEEVWSRMSMMSRLKQNLRLIIFKISLDRAEKIFPQTSVSEARLKKYYQSKVKSTSVIPMGVSTISKPILVKKKWPDNRIIRLVCLTRYYSHKNLEIFVEVGSIIKEKGLPINIDITVSQNQCKATRNLMNKIKSTEAKDVVRFIGEIPMTEVIDLYQNYDGMILPTLLESYSAVYADSLAYGMPLFTSDLDFAHDACGEAAHYFDPLNPIDIVWSLEKAIKAPNLIEHKVFEGLRKAGENMDWFEIGEMYECELKGMIK